MYKHLIDHVTLQFYLCKPIPMHIKKYITKIRLSSHNLHVESVRTNNTPRSERKCFFCNNDIEDEFHFVLMCPVYVDLRKKYIKKYYWERPSVIKLTQLLSVNNVSELCSLGKYIRDAFQLRSNILTWYTLHYFCEIYWYYMYIAFDITLLVILPSITFFIYCWF